MSARSRTGARRAPRLAAIAALLLAVLAVVALLAGRGDDRRELTVVLDQAAGLLPGSRVLVAGVPAGEVRRIDLGPDGYPRVVLALDDDVHPRAGARADLRLTSNSGELNRVVALEPGRGAPLPDGATLPRGRTAAPVELDDVLDALPDDVRADVRHVVARLDGATDGLDVPLRRALRRSATAVRETASLLGAVTADGTALRTLVRQGHATAATLARGRDDLGRTVERLSGTLATAAARQGALREAVVALPGGLREPRRALRRLAAVAPDVARLLRDARPATATLPADAVRLERALRAARPLLRQGTALAREAPSRLAALRPLLTALRPAIDRLTPTLRELLPVTDVLRVYTPEVAGFLTNWAGVETSYDAAGHGARLAMSQATIPNRVVGLDTIAPGFVPRPYLRDPGALVDQPWRDHRGSWLSGKDGGR